MVEGRLISGCGWTVGLRVSVFGEVGEGAVFLGWTGGVFVWVWGEGVCMGNGDIIFVV